MKFEEFANVVQSVFSFFQGHGRIPDVHCGDVATYSFPSYQHPYGKIQDNSKFAEYLRTDQITVGTISIQIPKLITCAITRRRYAKALGELTAQELLDTELKLGSGYSLGNFVCALYDVAYDVHRKKLTQSPETIAEGVVARESVKLAIGIAPALAQALVYARKRVNAEQQAHSN